MMSVIGYAKAGRRQRAGDHLRRRAVYLIVLIFFLPALWIILTSMRQNVEINTRPPVWIPSPLTLNSTRSCSAGRRRRAPSAWAATSPSAEYARNSIIIAAVSTLISLAFGTLAGYAFARFAFKAKNGIFLSMMLARAVPGIALSLPLFVLFARVGLSDSVPGMIITYIALNVPFTAWLMDGFFRAIPQELDEAALIDGCSRWDGLPARRPAPGAAGRGRQRHFRLPDVLERVRAGQRHHAHALGLRTFPPALSRVHRPVCVRLARDVCHVGDDAHPGRHLRGAGPAPLGRRPDVRRDEEGRSGRTR